LDESWIKQRAALARDILTYLENHPEASDTMQGIGRWWTTGEAEEPQQAEMAAAVALLVDEGVLMEIRRTGLPPYYRLHPDARSRISQCKERLARA
jgi:hypothetical protein